jgi:hypothetical protein
MPTGAEQATVARGFAASGDYPGAYRYIAGQIDGDPAWNPALAAWFEKAAQINGPVDNFWKRWVFDFNAIATGRDPDSAEAIQKNQDVSDRLARNVIEQYARAVEGGNVVSPEQIYREDFGMATREFNLPPPHVARWTSSDNIRFSYI